MKMEKKSGILKTTFLCSGMLILILDSKLVVLSACAGIEMCLKSIIPALFPFLVMSGIITTCITIKQGQKGSHFLNFLDFPNGAGYLLILGFLGGYPNGAQNVYQLYKARAIRKEDAEKLLPICNQAGPAFIFGILPFLFSAKWIPCILWIIQIISALLTSAFLPGKHQQAVKLGRDSNNSVVATLQSAVRTMGWICGWVVLFRIIIGFLEARLLMFLPIIPRVIIAGLLELTNGIFALNVVKNDFVRFILASVFLSFGGFCVILQTQSVAKDLNLKLYFGGKLLQLLIAALLSVIIYPLISFTGSKGALYSAVISLIIVVMIAIFTATAKKTVAIQKNMLYNKKKSESEVLI